jgi:hypothetical protein
MRHDRVGAHLHYLICKALGIETTEKWYIHMPTPLCEHEDVTVFKRIKRYTHIEKLWQIGQI